MKKFLLFFAFVVLCGFTYAQFDEISQTDAADIKKKVLVVLLDEPDAGTLKKLAKKKPEQEHYLAQIEGKNQALKRAIETYWTYSPKVEFKLQSEYKKEKKNNKDNTILSFEVQLNYEKVSTNVGADGKPAGWNATLRDTAKGNQNVSDRIYAYNASTKYTSLANEITTLLIEGNDFSFSVFLPNVYPSYADIIYGIQQMQYCLRYYSARKSNTALNLFRQIKKNTPILKKKTLLIDALDLDKAATAKKIKEVYRYPFKIVSQDSIDKVIISKDSMFAYIQIINTPTENGNMSAHYICNPANGMIYCYDLPILPAGVKPPTTISYSQRIKLSNFKAYAKNIR